MNKISNEQIAHDMAIALLPSSADDKTPSHTEAVELYLDLYNGYLQRLNEHSNKSDAPIVQY